MPPSELADALVVVDMQLAFVEGPGAIPMIGVVRSAVQAQLDAAHAAGALVVFIQNDGSVGEIDEPNSWGWELALGVDAADAIVRKQHDDAFVRTGLEGLLRENRVETVSICGVLSEMCVAATARTALRLGFAVVLAHDSHGTYNVPPLVSGEEGVPARLAARAAEWSLGDAIRILPNCSDVAFRVPAGEDSLSVPVASERQ